MVLDRSSTKLREIRMKIVKKETEKEDTGSKLGPFNVVAYFLLGKAISFFMDSSKEGRFFSGTLVSVLQSSAP